MRHACSSAKGAVDHDGSTLKYRLEYSSASFHHRVENAVYWYVIVWELGLGGPWGI